MGVWLLGDGGSVDGMLEEYKIYFVFHIMAYSVKLVTIFLCVILDLTIGIWLIIISEDEYCHRGRRPYYAAWYYINALVFRHFYCV